MRQYLFQTAHKFGQFGRQLVSLFQERNALFVFADFLRFIAAQIIQTGTAVRIDIPIRLVFAVEIFEDEEEGKVLEHIGMVAGMEGVAVAKHDRAAGNKNPIIPQTIAITAFRRPLYLEMLQYPPYRTNRKEDIMFTGIVQGMGKITDIAQPSPDFRTHTVELPPRNRRQSANRRLCRQQWLLPDHHPNRRQQSQL